MKHLASMVMVLLGAIMYGTMSSFVKRSYTLGYNAAEIALAQAGLAALLLAIYTGLTKTKSEPPLTPKAVISILLTGCAIGLTNLFYYQSVQFIPASLSIVILMQFTWFSLLLEWLIFKVKPSRIEFYAVVCILVGTVLAGNMLALGKWIFSIKGILMSLFSSLTYACYIVANGRIGKAIHWSLKSTIIMTGSACIIFLVKARTIIIDHHFNIEFLLWSIFYAVVGTTIPTALFAASIPKVGAGLSAILMTVELPVAVICASLILDERMNLSQITGIIIMLTAITAMNYYQSIKSEKHQ